MSCCVTLNGIVRDCGTNIGGIKRAWIACYRDVNDVTVANDEITAIDFAEDAFKEFEFRRQTGSVTITPTFNDSGSVYYESTIVLQFNKMETAKRIEIAALAVSDLVIIVQDENDKFWYFGFSAEVRMTEGTGETGTAWGDFNGYNITLTDSSIVWPYEVTEEAMQPIINPTVEP